MSGNHPFELSPVVRGNSGIPVRRRDSSGGAFTLIELLVVISIIAVLAGLIVGLAGYATRKNRDAAIRAEMNKLITAIEAYNAAFGQYPPDNVVRRNPLRVDPLINPLYYELSGTIVDNDNKTFRTPNVSSNDLSALIPAGVVKSTFNMDGFVNAKPDPKDLKKLPITFTSKQYGTNNSVPEIRLLAVPVAWPLNQPPLIGGGTPGLNPWRYVSTSPTNNPTSFDLWAEYVDGKKIKIICNWSKDILEP